MLTTIQYGHLILDCDHDYEPADRGVGYYGSVQINGVFHAGKDITELLSKEAINAIEDSVFEEMGR